MANCFHALIVEDDPAIVELLISMLEESQYHVSSASTVAEALAFLRTSHVDVVLADNLLPDSRGMRGRLRRRRPWVSGDRNVGISPGSGWC